MHTKKKIFNKKKKIKYSRKNTIINSKQTKKHYYFITGCKVEKLKYLDDTILENYLKKLKCITDKTIKELDNHDKKLAKKHSIKYEELCQYSNKIKPYEYDNQKILKNIKADLFFYNDKSKFLNKRLYPFNKYLLNVLNIDFANITDKDKLYNNISKIAPEEVNKYFIKTFYINELKNYIFPGWYILRPINSLYGLNIKYIYNRKELNEAIQFYNTTKNHIDKIYGNEVIASSYITDLLLFRGKKMHLRMYYMISCLDGVISFFLLDNGKILTASEPFDMEHPFTKKKHDTHVESTGADFTIKRDFTTENIGIEINDKILDKIYKNCKYMCKLLSKMILNEISNGNHRNNSKKLKSNILFDHQQNGYHLCGLDVFITKDLQPVLIECNTNAIGMSSLSPEFNIHISKMIYGWINAVILEPLLKYDRPMPMKAREHKTYIHLD